MVAATLDAMHLARHLLRACVLGVTPGGPGAVLGLEMEGGLAPGIRVELSLVRVTRDRLESDHWQRHMMMIRGDPLLVGRGHCLRFDVQGAWVGGLVEGLSVGCERVSKLPALSGGQFLAVTHGENSIALRAGLDDKLKQEGGGVVEPRLESRV